MEPDSKAPIQHLTVFLLKDSVRRPAQAVKAPEELISLPLRKTRGGSGRVFVASPRGGPPSWVRFLATAVDGDLPALRNASSSAVLVCRVQKRFFALTFGYGRSLLAPHLVEPDFGLRVALNAVDPDKLRSVDARTFEDLMIHTRRQTSRATSVDSFGIDVSRDLLRAVTGSPTDISLGTRITGSDAVAIDAQVAFDSLSALFGRLLRLRESRQYRKRFAWVDQLAPVRDRDRVAELDLRVADALRSGDTSSTYLASPEIVEYDRGLEFGYSTANRQRFIDLDLQDFINSLGEELQDLSPNILIESSIRVYAAGSEQAYDRWSVYDSLVCELKANGRLFVLMGGQWFDVESRLVRRVEAFLRAMPKPNLKLPAARIGESEGDYNARAASSSPNLALLDKIPFRVDGAGSPIEACDVFSSRGHFVHVKKKTRSASLSHLFAQGLVSAQAFLHDRAFRKKLHETLRSRGREFSSLVPIADRPIPNNYTVAYAIVARSDLPLPFFSKLNLMQTAQRLGDLGYRTTLTRVPEGGARQRQRGNTT